MHGRGKLAEIEPRNLTLNSAHIIGGRSSYRPSMESSRDPNKKIPDPGSRCSLRKRRTQRNHHSCYSLRNYRRTRCHFQNHRNRIRVSSVPSQASRTLVCRNSQKLTPGQASLGKMRMRRYHMKTPTLSQISIHHREIHVGRQILDARNAVHATRIANLRMRIGS
jgi:hypothetical protein